MVSGAMDTFLASYPEAVRSLALRARKLVREALPGVEESLDEAGRVVGYGYGAGYTGLVCTLIPSQSGVKLGGASSGA
jgi:hypothetical protein